jgi:hypothetical protein
MHQTSLRKLLSLARRVAARPWHALQPTNGETFKQRLDREAVVRPYYAYGTYHAAVQARSLGMSRMSVIEFGVAGGNGLVDLEELAMQVENEVGVAIDVYGFDSGEGMPESQDFRDLPYLWKKGFFRMDVDRLKTRLKKSRLMLGDVKDTVPRFVAEWNPAPIGFVSFDLDYYSSTVLALKLFDAPESALLPRIFCYFDDCIGDDAELHCQFTGELLAIHEFNEQHASRKIAKINGLPYKRQVPAPWHEVMYVCHVFEHSRYCEHINSRKDWQFPLVK